MTPATTGRSRLSSRTRESSASSGRRTPASSSSGWTSSPPGDRAARSGTPDRYPRPFALFSREPPASASDALAGGSRLNDEEHVWYEYGKHRALRAAEARVDRPVRPREPQP